MERVRRRACAAVRARRRPGALYARGTRATFNVSPEHARKLFATLARKVVCGTVDCAAERAALRRVPGHNGLLRCDRLADIHKMHWGGPLALRRTSCTIYYLEGDEKFNEPRLPRTTDSA
eukprot:5816310-Prymnesium_polylepis.2